MNREYKTPTLDFSFMLRIAYWVSSYNMEEGLSLELFNETYGTAMGKHYYDKWEHLYHHNIMKMYFGLDMIYTKIKPRKFLFRGFTYAWCILDK